MSRARAWLARLAGLFGRTRREHDLSAELESHLSLHIDDNLRAGMSPEAARRHALIKLGGLEQAKQLYREQRGVPWLEDLWRDAQYGARMLRNSPGFTAIAVLTMALGIGGTTSLFSVVNGVLLNPLPYKEPNRLVAIFSRTRDFKQGDVSYLNFLDWRRDNRVFSTMAAFVPDDYELTGMGEPERVKVERVSASFFPLLGVKPFLGRQFTAREDRIGGRPVVLISDGFWQREFGGARDVVGKTLTLNDIVYTIAGVIPAGFRYESGNFQGPRDLYVPIGQWSNSTFRNRAATMGMFVVGRLRPGVTLARAQADMDLVARHLAEQYPKTDEGVGVTLEPLKQAVVGNAGRTLSLLLGAVGLVLLIACANVANLLLARSSSRHREFAIRTATGATQGRMIRQLLTESALLALAGGALGLGMAAWGTRVALNELPEALPLSSAIHLDGHVLLFTLAVSALAGFLFGLAPALGTRRVDLRETLKEGGRGSSGKRHRTQGIFVAGEMALAAVLLLGAGLMIRSLVKLWGVDPGFDPHHVLAFGMSAPKPLGATPDAIRAAFRRIQRQIESVPGVEAAALKSGALPMDGAGYSPFWLDGEPKPTSPSAMKKAVLYIVQPDYLKVLKLPLIRGRFFTPQDDAHSAPVVVIDRQFARLYFGDQDPIGRRVNLYGFGKPSEIVGIVGHVKQRGLDAGVRSPLQAQIYFPLAQFPDRFVPLMASGSAAAVRTRGAPLAEVAAIRRALDRYNGQLVIYGTQSMEGLISRSLAARRFSTILLSVFAGLALLLSCVGIYGVISYLTSQRAHEIGIRMALGAEQREVLRMVLGQGAKMTLAGVAIGLAAALGLTHLLSRMLFGVSAHDAATFLAASALLVLVALAACYVPARRAARSDPVVALREE